MKLLVNETWRQCKACLEFKNWEQFYKCKDWRNWREAKCSTCRKKAKKINRDKPINKLKARNRIIIWRRTEEWKLKVSENKKRNYYKNKEKRLKYNEEYFQKKRAIVLRKNKQRYEDTWWRWALVKYLWEKYKIIEVKKGWGGWVWIRKGQKIIKTKKAELVPVKDVFSIF